MNKAYLIIAAMFFLAASVLAQSGEKQKPTPEEMARFRTNKMLEKGIINQDQFDKAYEINLKEAEEMGKADQLQREQREKIRADRQAIHKRYEGDWDQLLTPDQREKMKQERQAKGDRMKSKHDHMKRQRFHQMKRMEEQKVKPMNDERND